MTYAEIKTEVSRRLAEVSGRVFFSDQDIVDAIGLAYDEITDASEWNELWTKIDLLNDRPYYNLRSVVGDNYLSIKQAFDIQTNRWLIPSSVRVMDVHDRRWERVTGEPQRIFMRGLFWLGFYPRIQTDVGQVKQYYTALAEALVDDDDEPGFPDTFHYGLVEFALTDLFAQDGEASSAMEAWKAYLAIEGALTAWVQGRASDPLMHGFDSDGTSVQR